MRLTSLDINNFRSFNELHAEFNGALIGFVGENGLGKTNILESIYFLSQGSSWRSSHDFELISKQELFSKIAAKVSAGEEEIGLSIALQRDTFDAERTHKRYFVNDIPRTKKIYSSNLSSILFIPEDMLCVTGSPGIRRAYLDRFLSSVDDVYAVTLSRYQRVLTNRNKLLEKIREREAQIDQLDYWTEQMITLGSLLYSIRNTYFNFSYLNHTELYKIAYLPNVSEISNSTDISVIVNIYRDKVEKNQHKEILSAHSQYGPHKDDYEFYVEDSSAGLYASRGQQRSVLLWFIKSQLHYLTQVKNNRPVVLLDDMFSELDTAHRRVLLDMFDGFQVFITGCEHFYFTERTGMFDQVFEVSSGKIKRL